MATAKIELNVQKGSESEHINKLAYPGLWVSKISSAAMKDLELNT